MATTQDRKLLLERTVLDEQMRRSRQDDPQPWGPLPWLGPVIANVAIIVLGNLVLDFAIPETGLARTVAIIVFDICVELVLFGALIASGRTVAARNGGWRTAFGLDGVRTSDWLPWVIGVGFAYVGRMVVGVLANLLSGGKALSQAANLRLAHPGPLSITVLALTAVVLAPVAEELMFRGLLLRTFMRRLSFWPSALLSTLAFGLFHVYEVHTLLGAVTLALSVSVMGLCNCWLVRITGRLTPGIMVHMTLNALALAVAVVSASH